MFLIVVCLFYYISKFEFSEESNCDPYEGMSLTNKQLMASNKMREMAEGQNTPGLRIRNPPSGHYEHHKLHRKDSKTKNQFKDQKIGKLIKVKSLGLLTKQLKLAEMIS